MPPYLFFHFSNSVQHFWLNSLYWHDQINSASKLLAAERDIGEPPTSPGHRSSSLTKSIIKIEQIQFKKNREP